MPKDARAAHARGPLAHVAAVVCAAAIAACGGGQRSEPAADPVALGEPMDSTLDAHATGLAACDEYVSQVNRCLIRSLSGEEQTQRMSAMKQELARWNLMRQGGVAEQVIEADCRKVANRDAGELRAKGCRK